MSGSFSKRLGETLAHVQDFFDTVVHYGIKRVSESDKTKDPSKIKKPSKVGKVLRFFSEMGDTYYNKYSNIKSDQKQPDVKE